MRIWSICNCLPLVAAAIVMPGCSTNAYIQKGAEVKTNIVKISNCKADPDTVLVPRNQTLTWTLDPPDGHTYSIHFPKKTPLVSANPPTGQDQNVKGDFWCNTLGGISTNLCIYPYDVMQDDTHTKCPDPGVHVGSGGP